MDVFLHPCMMHLISLWNSLLLKHVTVLFTQTHLRIFSHFYSPSRAISHFFDMQLLMKCPLRIPMCCSLLGNGENRESAVWLFSFFFFFLFVTLAVLANEFLISTCVHVDGKSSKHESEKAEVWYKCLVGWRFFSSSSLCRANVGASLPGTCPWAAMGGGQRIHSAVAKLLSCVPGSALRAPCRVLQLRSSS